MAHYRDEIRLRSVLRVKFSGRAIQNEANNLVAVQKETPGVSSSFEKHEAHRMYVSTLRYEIVQGREKIIAFTLYCCDKAPGWKCIKII